ncbi:lanthionine synthetase C family protein [Streptomyces sp. NPDC020965]|uniref:lanthionine synthetase C family protein n=1 Tax=Streptomyces sp. NPDC020965 TaxID=3365105 RepID=UPI0037B853B6
MSQAVETRRHRDRAAKLSDALAERLRDPGLLTLAHPADDTSVRWKTTSLATGYAGISLLFSERSLTEPSERLAAHRYLGLAARALKVQPHPYHGLFYEIAGLGFGLHMARQAGGGYGNALERLDTLARESVRGLCHVMDASPVGPMDRFDVLDGLAGIGRYLLLRGLGETAEMELLLSRLAAMVEPVGHVGRQVPRFWSSTPPNWLPSTSDSLRASGHLNLGLAHGIAGPLALLSIAHLQGATVSGHQEAIESLVDLLTRFERKDQYGPYWPAAVSLETYTGGAWELEPGEDRGRVSWCYGTPGVSRALQLAGRALRREDWLRRADASVAAVTRMPLGDFGIHHWSVCHGWVGAMIMLEHFTEGPDGHRVRDLIDTIAGQVIDGFDERGLPPLQIGSEGFSDGHEPAGFLEGAAGLALALNSYSRPGQGLPWNIALVVN